jgi:hypothetical protein
MSASSPGFLRLVGCPKKAFLWASLEEKGQKPMAKSHLALVTPATVIGTVGPRDRPPWHLRNAEARARRAGVHARESWPRMRFVSTTFLAKIGQSASVAQEVLEARGRQFGVAHRNYEINRTLQGTT